MEEFWNEMGIMHATRWPPKRQDVAYKNWTVMLSFEIIMYYFFPLPPKYLKVHYDDYDQTNCKCIDANVTNMTMEYDVVRKMFLLKHT